MRGIDRDMAGMRAVAVGADRGRERALRLDAGELGRACALLARRCTMPSAIDDLLVGKAEALGRRLGDRGEQIVAAVHHRRAAHHHRARREGAEAFAQIGGRAVQDLAPARTAASASRRRPAPAWSRAPAPAPTSRHRRSPSRPARRAARAVLLAGAAAFDERHRRETVIAAVDQSGPAAASSRPSRSRSSARSKVA